MNEQNVNFSRKNTLFQLLTLFYFDVNSKTLGERKRNTITWKDGRCHVDDYRYHLQMSQGHLKKKIYSNFSKSETLKFS